jgi:hypothetical protein
MEGNPAHRFASPLTHRGWTCLTVTFAAAIAVIAIVAPSAGAYIYLAGPMHSRTPAPSVIERMTLDGSGVQPDFIAGPRIESGDSLHVYGDRLYWLDASAGDCRVASASLEGTDVQTLATLQSQGCGSGVSMTLAAGYLYWSSLDTATIGRMSVEPPYSAQPDFIRIPQTSMLADATSLVTDGEWLYWFDEFSHSVGRARLDGTDVDPAVFQPVPATGQVRARNVWLLGVAQGYLWWRDGAGTGSIGRALPDGSDREPNYLTGIHAYDGTLTSQWLYYTGSSCGAGCVDVDGAVRRVALDPGAVPQLIANLGPGVGSSIAVDSLGDPFPAVRITNRRHGTAMALVSTPRPAKVSVGGKRIVHARARQLRSKVASVPIRPRSGARRALRHRGAVHVSVRIAYRPTNSMPQFRTRSLTLRLGRR